MKALIHKLLTTKVMIFLLAMGNVFVRELGGISIRDFFDQVFFLKYKFFAFSMFLFSVGVGAAVEDPFGEWVESYVYAPKLTLYCCIATTISEWLSGILKAMIVDQERFDLVKGISIVPKLAALIWAVSTSFHFGVSEELFWLPSSVSFFFFGFNSLKTGYHLAKLKVVPEQFVEFMEDKFNLTKPKSYEEERND